MLVSLMSAYTNFFLRGNFLETFKSKFLSRTCSADREIDRFIGDVIINNN